MNNLSITFNKNSFIKDIMQVSNATATLIANDIASELGKPENDYRAELSQMDNSGISYKVGSSNWNAFLEQFGKGSKMSMDNPFLDEYFLVADRGWNPVRTSTTIVPRVRIPTKAPDWDSGYGYVEYVSTSNNPLFNIESLGGIYSPYAGSEKILEIFRTGKQVQMQRLKERFESLMNLSLKLSDYVKGGS